MTTRREKFLAQMEQVVPWARLVAVIAPHYPKGQRGRPPIGLERMLWKCSMVRENRLHGLMRGRKPKRTQPGACLRGRFSPTLLGHFAATS